MNVLSLFDGMSCGRLALNQSGIHVDNYYASEIDGHAINVAQRNFSSTIQLGNIKNLCLASMVPREIDLLIGGSPCQDLSNAKKGVGLIGEKSSLLHTFITVKNFLRPKFFLLENVVPGKREWLEEINKLTGVSGVKINSDLFVAQNRERIYWTNIPIAELPMRPNWNSPTCSFRNQRGFRWMLKGTSQCLTARMGTGGGNIPLKSENRKDELTPEECEALQGMPHGYTLGVSKTQRYKMIGNGWTIPVISHILNGINR